MQIIVFVAELDLIYIHFNISGNVLETHCSFTGGIRCVFYTVFTSTSENIDLVEDALILF